MSRLTSINTFIVHHFADIGTTASNPHTFHHTSTIGQPVTKLFTPLDRAQLLVPPRTQRQRQAVVHNLDLLIRAFGRLHSLFSRSSNRLTTPTHDERTLSTFQDLPTIGVHANSASTQPRSSRPPLASTRPQRTDQMFADVPLGTVTRFEAQLEPVDNDVRGPRRATR